MLIIMFSDPFTEEHIYFGPLPSHLLELFQPSPLPLKSIIFLVKCKKNIILKENDRVSHLQQGPLPLSSSSLPRKPPPPLHLSLPPRRMAQELAPTCTGREIHEKSDEKGK